MADEYRKDIRDNTRSNTVTGNSGEVDATDTATESGSQTETDITEDNGQSARDAGAASKPKRGRSAKEPKPVRDADAEMEMLTGITPEDLESDTWPEKIYQEPSKLPLSVKDICFHSHDAKGNPTGVVDNRVFIYLTHTNHIFVCGGIPYIYRDGYYQADYRGSIIKTLIRECCLEQFIRSTTIDRVFKLFLQYCELEKQPEELNHYTRPYINFENGMYDVKKKKLYPHSPKALSINQIPWSYDPNADHGSGTEIEKFLSQAIPDETDREMLLEYIGLCCTKDVSQQKMLIICGDGGTGKSTVINLVQKLVGKRNTSNVAMSKLSENFQAIRMMGKLLNSCADLEIDALDDVTMIKKLIGEDSISDSYKGKDIISFDNYAKLLFSTNELPLVRNEKTEGFYRRLLILTMNEKPKWRDPRLAERLENEIPYLLHLAMEALHRMYMRGSIIESEASKERVRQLRNDSDTIEAFLNDGWRRTGDESDKVKRDEIFKKYKEYCESWGRQAHTKNNFYKALRNKGYQERRSSADRYFVGIKEYDPATDENGFLKIPDDFSNAESAIPFD